LLEAMDLARSFATFDRANYSHWWKLRELGQVREDAVLQGRGVRVGAPIASGQCASVTVFGTRADLLG